MTRTSVIIPCYNVQDFLGEALESVCRQTAPVREIILVDDGSATPIRHPERWAGPPLEIVRTENRGLPSARNLGIARATGEYVAFLDADDSWDPRKVERQEQSLDERADAVAAYTRCAAGDGLFAFGPYPPKGIGDDEFLIMLWYHSFFPPSAVMARRDALVRLGGFKEDLGNGEDIELWLRLMTLGAFVEAPEPLTFYRVHEQQFTKNTYKKMIGGKQARAAMIAQHADRLVSAGIPQDKLWHSYRNDVLLVYYRRDFQAARKLLWDYFRDHPTDRQVLKYALVSCLPALLVGGLFGRAAGSCPASQERNDDEMHAAWRSAYAEIRRALAASV